MLSHKIGETMELQVERMEMSRVQQLQIAIARLRWTLKRKLCAYRRHLRGSNGTCYIKNINMCYLKNVFLRTLFYVLFFFHLTLYFSPSFIASRGSKKMQSFFFLLNKRNKIEYIT